MKTSVLLLNVTNDENFRKFVIVGLNKLVNNVTRFHVSFVTNLNQGYSLESTQGMAFSKKADTAQYEYRTTFANCTVEPH
jgi:hypothetical protein